jgi:hypothetical protein
MELNLRTTMRIRGMVKLISIAMLVNQVLTFLFAYVTDRLDPGAPVLIRSVFSFATCWLVSSWLQTDARQAYVLARDKGFVTPIDDTHPALHVSPECPKRWLVVLHIEMNPAVVGL